MTLNTESKYYRASIARGLAAAGSGPGVSGSAPVDPAGGAERAGLISGMAIITRGEALGHGLWIDATFLTQTAAAINATPSGAKSRFTHPGLSGDGLGKQLGRVRGATVDGDCVRGDLHFSLSSHSTPDGDLARYVLDLAVEDPAAFGNSIAFKHDAAAEEAFALAHGAEWVDDPDFGRVLSFEFFESPDPDNVRNLPHARLASLRAVDVVDEPAANPAGLFSAGQDLPAAAEQLLDFALGRTAQAPAENVFGVHPQRVAGFFQRYLARHNLTIQEVEPMAGKRKLAEGKPVPTPATPEQPLAEEPAPVPVDPSPAPEPPVEPEADPEMDPAETPVPEEDPDECDPQTTLATGPGQAYLDAFGPQGGVWFAQGKSLAECHTLFAKSLAEQVTKLEAKNKDLETAVSQLRGANPVSSAPVNPSAVENTQLQNLGPNLGRVASAIEKKMPGAK